METPNNNQQTTGLQIFFKEDIDANVRVKVINGAPWFVGKDVAASLGYTKTRNAISQHVDNEDALKQGVPDNQGFIQETILINESGMYALIFGSKLPTAKAFKRWVTNEVLPSIRRTGGYPFVRHSIRRFPHPSSVRTSSNGNGLCAVISTGMI